MAQTSAIPDATAARESSLPRPASRHPLYARPGARSSVARIGLGLALASGVLAAPASARAQARPAPAPPQAVVRVSDDVFFRFGLLLQGWANFSEVPATDAYTQELFIRRIRVLVGGALAKNLTFFVETDAPNLGRATNATKALGNFVIQDAILNFNYSPNHYVDAGLILLPVCRNCVTSATTLLTLDYGSYSFLHSAPTQSSVGRDFGAQARGYLVGNRLEYRLGVYEGLRDTSATNPLRYLGRLQFQLLKPEARPFYYPAFYLPDTVRVFNVGVGGDVQADYNALSVDAFLSHPVGRGVQLNAYANWIRYDGGDTFATLLEQNTYFVESGVYFSQVKLMPFGRIEFREFDEAVVAPTAIDETRYQAGLTFFFRGNNGNVRGAFTRVNPGLGESTNAFTVQLQGFFY